MSGAVKAGWICAVMLAGVGLMQGQGAAVGCPVAGEGLAARCMYFSMERFGVEIPAWTMVVRGDGKAMYWESANLYGAAPGSIGWLPVSAGTVTSVFAAEAPVRSGGCSSHVTSLPMGGRKKLVSWTGDGKVECSFSRSTDGTVSAADAAFEAMAETMQAGEKLAREHAHERLALEGELDALSAKVAAGNAIEVAMIAPVLEGLIGDDLVVDVVKKKAAALLGK
jgi:hypothetical protein